MIIVVGLLESLIVFMIGLLIGVILSYELFSYDLAEKLINYEHRKMYEELNEFRNRRYHK